MSDEEFIIVLDIGTSESKVGFAGANAPDLIVSTPDGIFNAG